jgi:biotin synthase
MPENTQREDLREGEVKAGFCPLQPEYRGPRIYVLLQPEEKRFSLPRPKTVRQLLQAFQLREESALVVRRGELLTPDRRIWPDDEVLVRKVASSG